MELDAFKEELKKQVSGVEQRSASDITAILRNRTASLIRKLRQSLRVELAFTLAFTAVSVVILFIARNPAYRYFFMGAGIVSLVFAAFLIRLLQRADAGVPVKQYIEQLVVTISLYQRIYLWLGIALLPVSFVAAWWLANQDASGVVKQARWDVFGWLAAAMLAFGVLSFLFTRWYLRKMYGNYLDQLKKLVNEMEQE
ncbi:MAG TPA: hypothetical protein VF145_09250 [Chitinophagaceae bacterium]